MKELIARTAEWVLSPYRERETRRTAHGQGMGMGRQTAVRHGVSAARVFKLKGVHRC